MTSFLLLLLAFTLVLLNGFFVAAEFGMVRLRHTRIAVIKNTYGIRGKILAQVHKHLDAYLSACQLGITLASLGLGWVGEPVLAHLFRPLFTFAGINSQELITFISFFFAFSLLSFLHIVIGELVPKSLALRQSEKISIWTAIPLYGFYWLMYPAIWILNTCAQFILHIAKLDKTNEGENFYSLEEVKIILHATHVHGQITKQEIELLKHTLEFSELDVTDIMRPIDEMISLDVNQTIQQALDTVLKHHYSRYPIYQAASNDIIGIIHVKDVVAALHQHNENENLQSIIRPILKVPHRLPALELLNKLQEGMPHFALVYSSKTKPIGFVTLDNLFQVLVGKIRDEFHKTDESWIKSDDGSYRMNGNCSLYVVERALDIEIEPEDEMEETADTLFGLILTKLGRLPQEGERIEFKQFSVVIIAMQGHKIKQAAIYRKVHTS